MLLTCMSMHGGCDTCRLCFDQCIAGYRHRIGMQSTLSPTLTMMSLTEGIFMLPCPLTTRRQQQWTCSLLAMTEHPIPCLGQPLWQSPSVTWMITLLCLNTLCMSCLWGKMPQWDPFLGFGYVRSYLQWDCAYEWCSIGIKGVSFDMKGH